MKAKTLIMAFALFAVMTGCSKTETSTVVTPAGNKVTLKAYVNNPATKVGFASDGAFYWSEGDVLGVLDNNGTAPSFHEFTLNAEDKGNANGTFTGAFPEGTGFGDYAVYPYNAGHSVSGTTLTYDFPASYTYANMDGDYFTETQGTGNSFNAPMWGKIATGSVQMKHLGGVFCIKIADMPCTSGTLTLTSDQKISGAYTVDLSAADPAITAAAAATDEEKTVSITFSGATEKSPGVFYVPAPVGKHNIRIVIKDNGGNERLTFNWTYNIVRCGLQRADIFTLEGKTCAFPFKMVRVEGGTFTRSNGTNSQEVTLSDYYIGKYEVTQGLWKKVMGEAMDIHHYAGSQPLRGEGDDYPMYYVSWDDICTETTGFLARLNSMTGKTFTLPTEAQWEFAARGGINRTDKADGTPFYKYSGSNSPDSVAWYQNNSAVDGTNQAHPVGQKDPNELGIYDMSGNVEEWCADRYYWDYGTDPVENPKGPDTGTNRVYRGGSYTKLDTYCTVSYRGQKLPDRPEPNLGFRLALVLP